MVEEHEFVHQKVWGRPCVQPSNYYLSALYMMSIGCISMNKMSIRILVSKTDWIKNKKCAENYGKYWVLWECIRRSFTWFEVGVGARLTFNLRLTGTLRKAKSARAWWHGQWGRRHQEWFPSIQYEQLSSQGGVAKWCFEVKFISSVLGTWVWDVCSIFRRQ